MKFNKSLCAAAVTLAMASGSAFATNGYFAHGYGTKNKGMAGAGVALPQDAMTAATNPAGMAHVGNRMDFGAAVFSPLRSYDSGAYTGMGEPGVVGPDSVDSDRNLFLVPHFAYNKMLDDSTSVGVAVYGNGGMNTFYEAADTAFGVGTFFNPGVPGSGGTAGVDLMQLFIAPTFAKKMNDKVSVGVSAILAYQRFEAYGIAAFNGLSPLVGTGTDTGYDDSYGFGAKIGILANVSDTVTLGASYQSRVYMEEFDKYAGLFAEQGDFDIPSNFTVGVAIKPNNKLTVTADVQHIMYSEVDAIANPMLPNMGMCAGGDLNSCLGGSNGIGFGWDDMTVFKLGMQYEYSSDLTLRAGISHGDAPMAGSEVLFNVLAPAVVETHITVGGTKKMGKDAELSFSAMYAPESSVAGNPFGVQPIELSMHQFELEVSYGMTWK